MGGGGTCTRLDSRDTARAGRGPGRVSPQPSGSAGSGPGQLDRAGPTRPSRAGRRLGQAHAAPARGPRAVRARGGRTVTGARARTRGGACEGEPPATGVWISRMNFANRPRSAIPHQRIRALPRARVRSRPAGRGGGATRAGLTAQGCVRAWGVRAGVTVGAWPGVRASVFESRSKKGS